MIANILAVLPYMVGLAIAAIVIVAASTWIAGALERSEKSA